MRTTVCVLAGLLLAMIAVADEPKKPDESKKPDEKKAEPIGENHYRVYDARGNPSNLDAVLERMRGVSVVFLGEHHDDPVAHHLQLALLKKSHEQGQGSARLPDVPAGPQALALEMFERDVQGILDEYLAGLITQQQFKQASRPWKNYDQDYQPLVEFARENDIAVLASNAPRRYVNRVSRLGADSLKDIPDGARYGLPPLPYAAASPAYAAKFTNLMKSMHRPEPKKEETPKKDAPPPAESKKPAEPPKQPEHNPARGLEAQSLWDASMAYTIAEYLLRRPDGWVIHINGAFHSEQRMGICEHLLRYRPGTSLLVVTILPHKEFPKFDVEKMADRGDFVIVTDASLPRSYASSPPASKK